MLARSTLQEFLRDPRETEMWAGSCGGEGTVPTISRMTRMTSAPHRVGDGDGRGGEPRLGYRDARVVERQRTSERRSARGARGNRRDRGRRCWARGWRRACKWLTRWRGSGWAIGKISPVPRPAGMMLRAPAAIAAASRRNHADEAFTARRSSGSPLARRACASASRSAHKSTHPWERCPRRPEARAGAL